MCYNLRLLPIVNFRSSNGAYAWSFLSTPLYQTPSASAPFVNWTNTGYGEAVAIEANPADTTGANAYCIAIGAPTYSTQLTTTTNVAQDGFVQILRFDNTTKALVSGSTSIFSSITLIGSTLPASQKAYTGKHANYGSSIALAKWGTANNVLFAGAPGNNTVPIVMLTNCGTTPM